MQRFAGMLLMLAACHAPSSPPTTAAAAYTVPEDSAITKAVHDAYACISFKAGADRHMTASKTISFRRLS